MRVDTPIGSTVAAFRSMHGDTAPNISSIDRWLDEFAHFGRYAPPYFRESFWDEISDEIRN